ncbi:MAG: tyrosine--tRNA ligase [Candidatus Limnocylindrales bacterium]
MSRSALLDELGWRGLVHLSSEGLEQRLEQGPVSAYIGFDASATSLHVGHLLQVFLLTHLQRAGGRPVVLIGGGTGMIGDPSGKSSERVLLDADAIERNSAALKAQLERFLDFSPGPTQPRMLNNLDWLGQMSMIDYLRDIGKYFTVAYMLSKDSVQARLAAGMSFTEFSYQTLQAADFLHLHQHEGVDMQMGGADQWGNITAGLELIRRVESRAAEGTESAAHEPTAFGLCSPLLLNRAGMKMGKSEKGAVFLDGSLTSPYDFYQYWINDEDEVVLDHLRWLTTMSREEVEAITEAHAAAPEGRLAQKALAHDLTARIHGRDEAERQVVVASAAFATEVDDPEVLAVLYDAVGGFEFGAEADGWTAIDIAVAASGQSKGEARRLISQGGFRVNGQQLTDPAAAPPALIGERYWWVAMGKKRRFVGRRTA